MYGERPDLTDHINRIRSDNRLGNLRPATYKINAENRTCKGYTKRKFGYEVSLWIDGVYKYIGTFKDEELAELVASEVRLHYGKR